MLDIYKLGEDVLYTPTQRVTKFDSALKLLVDAMFETMDEADGVGLAAPQVGVSQKLFVVDDRKGNRIAFINPEIIEKRGEQTGPEGCLSVPGKTGMVTRAEYVKAKALDIDMNPIEVEGEGLLARAICHELDHLDGHLYTELVEGKLMTNEEFMEYLNANAKEGDSE